MLKKERSQLSVKTGGCPLDLLLPRLSHTALPVLLILLSFAIITCWQPRRSVVPVSFFVLGFLPFLALFASFSCLLSTFPFLGVPSLCPAPVPSVASLLAVHLFHTYPQISRCWTENVQ